jgi:RNA polymerase-binding transcription factor DksA
VSEVRARLAAEQAEVQHRLATLRGDFSGMVAASEHTNADDEHDPEGATIAFERAQLDALVRQAEQRLADVRRAIARLEAGEYGRCVVCGAPIPAARLEARPTAATCVGCASSDSPALERFGR